MIWNSVIFMTVVDLLIVGIAGSGLVYFLRVRNRGAGRQTIRGFGAIILGMLAVGGFFFADLLIMHGLPLFVPRARAMAIMTEMHLNLHWPMLLAGIGLTGFGLIAALRQIIVLIDRFDALETRTTHELKLREETEGALRESEARLKRAQRQAKLGYWRWSFAKERLTYWLEESVETGGESPGERDTGYDLMARDYHPEDRDRVLAEYHAADAERRDFEIEYRVMTKDGEIFHIREIAEIEYGANGEPIAHIGTVQDITALKVTEAALRESDASLANAQRIAGLGYWEVDLVTNELTWSDEMFRIMRVQKEDFDSTVQSFYARIHPNDREFLRHASEAAIYDGQAFDIDLRVVLPDGETRYLHEQAEVTFDDAGTPLRMSGTTHDITDRKRAEEAMWLSEARLANAQRIAGLGNWDWNIETDAVWWSDEFYRLLDVEAGDVEECYQSFLAAVHEDDRARFEEVVGGGLRSLSAFSLDHRLVQPNGDVRHVRQQAEAVCDDDGKPVRMTGVVHDITESRHAEENQRKSESRLAGILDITPEAIISIDRNGRIQLFNQGAESIFGYDSGEVLGQQLEVLLPTALRRRHAALVEEFDRAPEVSRKMSRRAEIVGVRKDGSEFPAEASLSKMDLGCEMLFTVLLRDVTERKQVERALLRGKDEAEIANRTKSEFLANMSHELRTPLNAIIGFAEIIMDEVLGPAGNEKYRGYAKDINDSGQHLLKIINDILDLSKIETGQAALCVEEIDVPEALRDSLKLIRERARSAGVGLVADIDSQTLPKLRADRRMLKQILVNLLSNAVKFTPQGGRVTVSAHCDPATGYALTVADTGIGIALEDIPKALARFEQVDAKLDRRYEGTGLGLPLSKAFVELHGGSLELESEVGVGTTVTVRFPTGCVESGSCEVAAREAG
ncbi:MAG: PAS domain-containing protein [Alphaproteobacteria bacterium]|nr:PAS domain-containing protein [Alphaproteobacteria bacterium]